MTGQTLAVQLYYDGSWHDVAASNEVFTAPITITQGLADESSALRPASVSLQLDNRTDKYRPTNPVSPLYGKAGRNTPIRVQIDGATRAICELSSTSTDQTQDFRKTPMRGKAWADVDAGGLLQRINQWSKPIRSPLYRYLSRLSTAVGYWPGEDGAGAKALYSPTPGATTDILRGCEFQSQSRAPGSAPVLVLPNNPNTLAGGRFAVAPGSTTAGYQLAFSINFGDIGGTGDIITFLTWETIDGASYSLTWVDGSDLLILGNTASGGTLINTTLPGIGDETDWNAWNLILITSSYSGGTTSVNINWITEGTNFLTSAGGGSFSGEPSKLSRWFLYAGAFEGNVFAGHVIGLEGFSEDLDVQATIDVFNGRRGELAAVRFGRLCDEEGIPYYVRSEWASSFPMGPQSVDTLANLFKEIATTDDGIIFDVRDELRLLYVGRADRYRRPVELALNPANFPALPREVFDDKGIWNVATASQRDGGEVTATDETSDLSVQPPPDGIGEKRESFDVTVADEDRDLPQIANWWLRRGTVDLPRFPKLTLDLATLGAGLVADIDGMQVGDIIEITGFRENTIRLNVIGWTETIRPADDGKVNRSITFNCAPDQQFVVGEWDASDSRWDLESCTLNGLHSSSATSLALTMTKDERWSATTPYDLMIAGERVTVTAMGARSGSGPYSQTATVTRSVNGIVKSLPAGSPVHVATPGRWAL